MKRIIIALLVISAFTSCEKKRCYECKFYDFTQAGVTPTNHPSSVMDKCGMTEKGIKTFVKDNENRKDPTNNTIVYAEDKMWVICKAK